jgi:hypothetical protein
MLARTGTRLDRANGACGMEPAVPEDESGLVVPGHAERQQQDDGAEDQGVEQCEMVEEGFHHSILLLNRILQNPKCSKHCRSTSTTNGNAGDFSPAFSIEHAQQKMLLCSKD